MSFDLECLPPEGGRPNDAKDARKAVPFLATFAAGKTAIALRFDDARICPGDLLRELLYDPQVEVIVHNALYDVVVLHERGYIEAKKIKAKLRDTMLLQFLLNENEDKGLKDMVRIHLRHRMKTFDEVTKYDPKVVEMEALLEQIKIWRRKVQVFPRARPWPNFDSENAITLSEVRKKLKKNLYHHWTGQPRLDKSGNQIFYKDKHLLEGLPQKKFSKLETGERAAYEKQQNKLIEERFGVEAQMEFSDWVETTIVHPALDRIDELKAALYLDMVEYAKDDAWQTLRLWNKLTRKIDEEGLIDWLEFECRARRVTTIGSTNGIPIDVEKLSELKRTIDPLIEEFSGEISNIVKGYTNEDGSEFNPNSSVQVPKVVFGFLQADIPVFFKTADGRLMPKLTPAGNLFLQAHDQLAKTMDLAKPETIPQIIREKYLTCDSEVLERVRHPIAQAILNLRAISKLRSTYIDKVIKSVLNHPQRRLLGYFNSIGTDTGRLSSSDPNLQNIPSRKKPDIYDSRIQGLGPKIREAFIAGHGKKMIVVDQSQIELRVITEFTRDRTLQEIYTAGVEVGGNFYYTGDIHTRTAKDLGIKRKDAKGVNFGFNYGMGPPKFARQVRLFNDTGDYDIEKATLWREGFFKNYPRILSYSELLKRQYTGDERKREFKMLTGRKKHYNRDDRMRGGTILNHKVQGSSADILKINMDLIDQYITPVCPSLEFIFQVHDELGYLCDPVEAPLAAMLIKYIMEVRWLPMVVPILASAKICDSWAAKDDDAVPEVGTYYARVDGQDRLFTAKNWEEYLQADKAGKVELKAATAILTHEDVALCKQYVPDPWEIPELQKYFKAA